MTSSYEPRVLVDGLAYAESPRWHDGRLWFSHWGCEDVLAVDLDGHCEFVAPGRRRPALGATGAGGLGGPPAQVRPTGQETPVPPIPQ
jgi:hypothetical protein